MPERTHLHQVALKFICYNKHSGRRRIADNGIPLMISATGTQTRAASRKERRAHGDPSSDRAAPLQKELRQKTPFPSLHAEAFLNLVRTADQMQHRLHMQLKPYGITETQYNSLRILRLERQGLVRRERGVKDRRVVVTKITSAGLQRLKELDPVVTNTVDALLAHLSKNELKNMIDLLERARWNPKVSS